MTGPAQPANPARAAGAARVASAARILEVATPQGPARVHVRRPRGARGLVVLGHGAGGGLGSVDLVTAIDVLDEEGWVTALVEQPWLVAGRRIAGRPPTLDEAWVPVVRALRRRGAPLVLGGRSAGARVACRTAAALRAAAVLCLSFPLHPPGAPEKSRAAELGLVTAAGLPLGVVQGDTDPFGTPGELEAYLGGEVSHLYPVRGTHTIPRGSAPAVADAVRSFIRALPR